MKKLITLLALFSLEAYAQEIEGTLMLKGTLKTKIFVNSVKTTCKLKVEKVRNLMEEDKFGNPGYQARVQISLDGSDFERNIKVKYDKELTIINMHEVDGVKIVKDFDYFNEAEQVKVVIDKAGRLVSTSFLYQNQPILCKF